VEQSIATTTHGYQQRHIQQPALMDTLCRSCADHDTWAGEGLAEGGLVQAGTGATGCTLPHTARLHFPLHKSKIEKPQPGGGGSRGRNARLGQAGRANADKLTWGTVVRAARGLREAAGCTATQGGQIMRKKYRPMLLDSTYSCGAHRACTYSCVHLGGGGERGGGLGGSGEGGGGLHGTHWHTPSEEMQGRH
jgi:hypothetical protein